MKTKDRKLLIGDTIYIFQVPAHISLDPYEIIKNGVIRMIKKGAMVGVDVFNEPLGLRARSWNAHQTIKIDVEGDSLQDDNYQYIIKQAIQRTKEVIRVEKEYGQQHKLYQLAVSKYNGKPIQRSDEPEPHYYIESYVLCDNCMNAIKGIQKLDINSAGKVAKIYPFEPIDETVTKARNGSKKLLCPECVVAITKPEEPEIKEQPKEDTTTDNKDQTETVQYDNKPTFQTPESLLKTILMDQETYSSEFARGAALMYTCYKEIK